MKSTLVIQNLKCGGCANTIITKISTLDNISEVDVDVEASSVSFTFQQANDLETVKDKLAHLGYPIEGDKNSMVSKAISYVSCATGKMSQ
ncbi:MAG: heavy-metal-associated domain-containing protein [Flavobacteriaceae bacterium]|nr:heavy-metal-associated domain-containing protein [Flavobacteriaceae bacterium]